ncbi:hypothetical protein Q3G72_033019 [Acer saccharum]|nr:hypothetical protein Q3G72_033019 [Acer saccharum]
MKNFPSIVFFLCLIIFSKLHLSDSKPSGFRFKLIPRDSPESEFPLYTGNLTQIERIQRMVEFNHAKANSYLNLLSTNQNSTLYHPDNLYVPIIRDDVFYYAGQVGIGTPPRMDPIVVSNVLTESIVSTKLDMAEAEQKVSCP